MIEKLNHFPVNWIDGMKINKTHFTEVQNFVSDSVRDAVGVHTSMIGYGLLPVKDPVKINLIIDNHKLLRIKVEECHAITPNGSRIEIGEGTSENLSLSIPYPEAVRELKDNEEAVCWRVFRSILSKELPMVNQILKKTRQGIRIRFPNIH